MAPVRVAALNDIPPGAMLAVTVGETPIVLFNLDGEFFALYNECSHAEAALSDGEFDPDEECVECPLHGSLFDIRSGRPRTLPAFQPVATYRAYAEDDSVFVEYST
ncbi:MAG: non-heme iron oxygenase ferredoxin subunit [Oscillochloris sp.]|nr:non-heme iron oxygenase ferredoxin subunit [Oscillochloris sp.]